jgi:hypothetical protein
VNGSHQDGSTLSASAISLARLTSQSGSAPVCCAIRSAARRTWISMRSTLPHSSGNRRSSHQADAVQMPPSPAFVILATWLTCAVSSALWQQRRKSRKFASHDANVVSEMPPICAAVLRVLRQLTRP